MCLRIYLYLMQYLLNLLATFLRFCFSSISKNKLSMSTFFVPCDFWILNLIVQYSTYLSHQKPSNSEWLLYSVENTMCKVMLVSFFHNDSGQYVIFLIFVIISAVFILKREFGLLLYIPSSVPKGSFIGISCYCTINAHCVVNKENSNHGN